MGLRRILWWNAAKKHFNVILFITLVSNAGLGGSVHARRSTIWNQSILHIHIRTACAKCRQINGEIGTLYTSDQARPGNGNGIVSFRFRQKEWKKATKKNKRKRGPFFSFSALPLCDIYGGAYEYTNWSTHVWTWHHFGAKWSIMTS